MKRHDFSVTAGDTKTLELSDARRGGETVDLTGWKVFMTAKESRSDTDNQAVFAAVVSEHLDPTRGTTALTITSEQTRAIANTPNRTVFYDIQFVSPNGKIVKTTHIGKITASRDVTQRTS